MAGTINVSGVFIFTVAASNAIYNEVTCNLAAIKMSAYNVQEQPVVFTFKKVDGDSKTALTAYPTLTVYNRSGASLTDHKPSSATSISYTIPVGSLPTADRVMVRIYSDDARTVLLAESASISVVRENPRPFPKGESWADDMEFKNGEMLLLDNMAYMWSSPVSGNSSVHPKTDIANNPTTTCWVAYQNWPLLCTNMMIARLALIGKAVFYDEFMFSQHGTDAAGNPSTNYQGFADGTFKPKLLFDFLKGNTVLDGSGIFRGSISSPYRTCTGMVSKMTMGEGMNIKITDPTAFVFLLDIDEELDGTECEIVLLRTGDKKLSISGAAVQDGVTAGPANVGSITLARYNSRVRLKAYVKPGNNYCSWNIQNPTEFVCTSEGAVYNYSM